MKRGVRKFHLALFGGVGLIRGECPECEGMTIIQDGQTACCSVDVEVSEPRKWKSVAEPRMVRGKPSRSEQKTILFLQQDACLYCLRAFGEYVWWHGRLVRLVVNWDHFAPFAYNQNNAAKNFVAACQICNAIKSSRIFGSVEDARAYIVEKLDKDNVQAAKDVQPVPEDVYGLPGPAEVLQPEVPEQGVAEEPGTMRPLREESS